jgi:hypothetical protein
VLESLQSPSKLLKALDYVPEILTAAALDQTNYLIGIVKSRVGGDEFTSEYKVMIRQDLPELSQFSGEPIEFLRLTDQFLSYK